MLNNYIDDRFYCNLYGLQYMYTCICIYIYIYAIKPMYRKYC